MNFSWVKPLALRSRQYIVRNAPHILMAMGTVEGIFAVIFAVKATPTALEDIREAGADKGNRLGTSYTDEDGHFVHKIEHLTVPETIKACWKRYIPALGMEVLSLSCFWGAHGIDVRRQAVLTGLCATAEEALRDYQRKVQEMIGQKAEHEIRDAQAREQVEKQPVTENNFYITDDSEQDFRYKGQDFRSTYNKVKEAQNLANHHMIQHMYISELELMWLLDPDKKYLKPDSRSGQVGWSVDTLITFDIHYVPDKNHHPVGVIEIVDDSGFLYTPSPGFSKMY